MMVYSNLCKLGDSFAPPTLEPNSTLSREAMRYQPALVFDIGLHKGEDTNFYLGRAASRAETNMNLILISTTDMKGGRADVRDRMLQALGESERTLRGDRMVLALLLQNCPPEELRAFAMALPAYVRPVAVAGRVPLSTARNILLRQLATDGAIATDTLVAFPDDDCWYPSGFLVQVAILFARNPELDLWFCRYASNPSQARFAEAEPGIARPAEIVRNASSNTIFMRGRVVNAIGEFDEGLGVGTPMGGAEDLDYVLRAGRVARRTAYCDAALVGHRDKSRQLLARYYASSLLVLARHARNGISREFHRKIAVGIYYVLRRRLPLAEFGRALRRASTERRKAKSPGVLNLDR